MSKFRAAIATAAVLAATVGGMVAMSGEAHADGRLKSAPPQLAEVRRASGRSPLT